jgi:hypothetical protein
MTPELEIAVSQLHDDGTRLALRVNLHNPADRTLHAYASLRALRYDPTTSVLEVQLSDRGLAEQPWMTGTLAMPRFTSVDPGGDTILELSVPRVITRLAPGQNQISVTFERRLAHEARYVDLEIAWSDTPFYADPRRKTAGPRASLVAWARGFARHRHTRDDPPSSAR